ncbi:hypothetical protein U1763_17355 [Sphingomonas sp. LB2R24]|uniref:hypothetical protein n=1 Tax=Sphingomonas sorbitolis TaxID=3096165 RepID=UPI002FC9DE17
MIGLVESCGDICTLSDIKAVQHRYQTPRHAEHYLLQLHSGGEPVKLFSCDYADLQARPVQLMPAEPGTRLITVFGGLSEDEKPIVDKAPIIAWALCVDGQVRPVTPAGVSRGFNPASSTNWYPEYLEMPNGAIHQFGYDAESEDFVSVAMVIERETRRQRNYETERKARAAARAEEANS